MDFTWFTWITLIGPLLQRQTNKVSLTYFILVMVTAQGISSQIPVYKDEMRSHLSQENSAAQNQVNGVLRNIKRV